MITIIDYDVGNLRSILNMFRHLGLDAEITGEPAKIESAEKLILPGVGKYDFGMSHLRKSGLQSVIEKRVMFDGVPILGICLGAQLLTKSSDEGAYPGLGWVDARTVAFDRSRLTGSLRVPHMAWADTEFRADSRLFEGVDEVPRYYYVHSFHLVCDNPEDELCYAKHGYKFVAAVEKDNVLGVQFHPEKSHRFGMKILRNFAENY